MKDFYGRLIKPIKNDTVRRMVLSNGAPTERHSPEVSPFGEFEKQTKHFYSSPPLEIGGRRLSWQDLSAKTRNNIEACVKPVSKSELLDYISHGERIDVEQSVAMVISYLRTATDSEDFQVIENDGFEDQTTSAVEELMSDEGVKKMLIDTTMWREEKDHNLLKDAREAATASLWFKITCVLKELEIPHPVPEPDDQGHLVEFLQRLRRKRTKLGNIQHLTFPTELLPDNLALRDQWSWRQNYKRGPQLDIPIDNPITISKHRFQALHKFLGCLNGPTDKISAYVLNVETFKKTSGQISPRRLEALQATSDPYAIAYSFPTAQRHRQLKVVSDPHWARFLVKGESAMILQNRPDVMTSFEDILVRHATDLVALTAVHTPQGLCDRFSSKDEILSRARTICEFMERYVNDFGDGNMENLVYKRDTRGGSGRGPVDVYNSLCDELRDCSARAKAVGFDLGIGPVYKFLAKDIMNWNNAWKDDAFADGKVPGWVGYLARVRLLDVAPA